MGDTRKRVSNSQEKFKHPLQHENRPDTDTEYSCVTSLFCQIYSKQSAVEIGQFWI